MPLELRFSTSSSAVTEDFGTGEPPWLNDLSQAWSFSSNDTDYGYSKNGNTAYIQYGQETSIWASNRFWAQSVEVLEQRTNADNSITATVKVQALFWKSRRVTNNAGYPVEYTISVNGSTIWTYSGQTTDTISKDNSTAQTFSVTVPAEERSSASALHIEVRYPQGQYDNNSFYVGLFLYNTNKKSFKPWAIRKSGIFKTLNRPSGIFQQRKNGWQDVSAQPANAVGKPVNAPHRVRKSGQWLGQGQIGQE